MNLQDHLKLNGYFGAHLIDPKWKTEFPFHLPKSQWPLIKEIFLKKNVITTNGRIRSYTKGYNFLFIAGGTGTVTATANDTILQSEVARFSIDSINRVPGQQDFFGIIPSGTGNITWQEWGVFMDDANTALGSGTMFNRVLQPFTKSLGDQILLTYSLSETL